MSGNQKQPAAGGPQTQRYSNSNSPYQPILTQAPNRSDGYASPAATYVSQTQGPNQGPGLRNLQPTGHPNQSSTPPNSDLKVPNLQTQIPMQFVQNPVRTTYIQTRSAGGPPTQAQRMPNHQHRAPAPPQLYQHSYVMQPLFIPQQPPVYYPRPPNNLMGSQSFPPQVYSQPITYQSYPSQASSGVPFTSVYPIYQPQAATMAISRPSLTPATAAPSNTTSGNLQNIPLMNQPGSTHNSYRSNVRQRRPKALSIIDPTTGEDKLKEILDEENASHPASGESSARQTPQPAPPNSSKEVQATFAKQVAQAINADRQHNAPVDQPPLLHESVPAEHFHVPPPTMQPILTPRCDVQNSILQYNAKEFISAASKPIKESTPIVSANSDAAEVTLPKKDRESPVKSRKQGQRDPKSETLKEFQPKETDCDRSSSIVKEDVAPVPQVTVVNTPPPVAEPSLPAFKETVKENVEKKGAKKPAPVESKSPEPEIQPQSAPVDVVATNGKSKNSRNKNVHNQNGKPQPPPQQPPLQQQAPSQQQQTPPQQQVPAQQQQVPLQQQQAPLQQVPPQPQLPSLPVPVPQPPKANNKSSKSKELNMKGANKEGTDMDAFNDNFHKIEINANVLPSTENSRVASNDVVNANPIPQSIPPTIVPAMLETDKIISETRKGDSNENVTTIKPDPVNINNIIPVTSTAASIVAPVSKKPTIKPFNVTSIVKDTVPNVIVPPFPTSENRDETDKAVQNDKIVLALNDVNSKVSIENALNDNKPALPYGPGQWRPDYPDGKRKYERDFLMALKESPASQQKPEKILDNVMLDDRNRQVDSRISMGGRTDFINPPFPNYGGKSGSQKGKHTSQSGKMGSRSGDKSGNKPQPKVSISLRLDVKLHQTENAWKPARFLKGDNMSEDEKKTEILYRKVRAVLNKLTPQKFDTLVNQVRQLQIDTKERLQGVIDLVFEKAIDEPSFSLAYAMMCKEIQNMQVSVGDEKKNLALRTLLIMRCQMEFENQSADETKKNAKLKEIEACTDPEKKKELTVELEEHERRARMRSVGTIRFIGELFKQQMLTATIMRRCLQTLLENKDEESLECLCKLLTTVGKELESNNNNKATSLASIFDEMKLIAEGKRYKVSSRIRFMLQDVMDLRNSKWVSRRGDTNPKTIDQIQKEAETEHMNIQVMNMNPPRKDDRGGGGPRGGPRQKVSDDGWSSAVSRNNRQTNFSIQTDKIRAAKLPNMDEPLGSSQMFGNWIRGAVGVKNPSLSTTNMYAALENSEERRPLNPRGNKDPYSSKGPSMERNSFKNYNDRGSRSGSQHRDTGAPMRSSVAPPSLPPTMPLNSAPQHKPHQYQAPVQLAAPFTSSVSKVSEEQIERRIQNSLDEFVAGVCTSSEYFQDISLTMPPSTYSNVVYVSYSHTLEKSQSARRKTGELFAGLVKSRCISLEDFLKGFEELLVGWEDLVIDIPQIWQYFAEDIVSLLLEEALPFPSLHKLLDSLIQANQAEKLLKPLFSIVVQEKGPSFLHNSWQISGLKLSDFMEASNVQTFVQENNLGFLLGEELPVEHTPLSYDDIQNKLSEFFRNKTPFDDIVNWISSNVGDRVKENKFIRALATAIFENSISKNKIQPDVLASHVKLIQKYVDNSTDYELQCLYALQSLVHKLEHPQGLLLSICDKLYEDSTFCQESFIAWESSADPAEQEGKGVALKQLTSFFTQLKENEEDDEYSSSEEA